MKPTDEFDDSFEPKSKSQHKREMHDLQHLGQMLTKLPPAKLRKLPLDDTILSAILDAQHFKNEALRRQLQYIGKLMRQIDAEPLRAALNAINTVDRDAAKQFHELEKWRERLLTEGNTALGEFITHYPHADSQHLHQLIHHAKHERENPQSGASRKLFRYLREVDEEK